MIELAPSDARELPVDELALLLLADIVATNVRNINSYGVVYRTDTQHGYHDDEAALQAIGEALAWLRARGMVARPVKEYVGGDGGEIFVTRLGQDALTNGVEGFRAAERLQENVHPLIQRRARRQFLLGEHEMAIFAAMKAVEVRVRCLGNFGDDLTGIALMTAAFKPDGGPLADPEAPGGEVVGTMNLFQGAYAVLRNPSGHREVSFEDVTEASEAVMTASLLMRMLDRIEARLSVASQG